MRNAVAILAAAIPLVSAQQTFGADEGQPSIVVRDERINESSGMALSFRHAGCLWLHNDSGDGPRLFLVNADDGATRGILTLAGASAVDWEDMSSFVVDGDPWLLVADVGDNQRDRGTARPACRIYLVREPTLTEQTNSRAVTADVTITLNWEGGPADCESVCVDPERREVLLLEKSVAPGCRLARIPLDLDTPRQQHTASVLGRLGIPAATAMDLAPDRRHLAVSTMWDGWLVARDNDDSWLTAFQENGRVLRLPQRRQGETICFAADSGSLFLNSEGVRQPLWRIAVPAVYSTD